MTTARRLAVLLSVAAPLVLGACDVTCPTESAALTKVPGAPNTVLPGALPACSGMAANSTVTVQLSVCPACNMSNPTCLVDFPASSTDIQLDPLVQVCDAGGSCPLGCQLGGITCTFQTRGPGDYRLVVIDPFIGQVTQPFQVVDGGASSCTGT